MSKQRKSGSYAKEKVVEPADPLGEALIAHGFAANDFLLSLNRTVRVPGGFEVSGQWALPSRMFEFPIETHEPDGDRPRTIGLLHPLLADHPFVRHFEQVMGFEVPRSPACNACGYSASQTATWWHAVDLAGAGAWQELIETRAFTTDADIFRAVAFALRHARKDEPIADKLRSVRRVMQELASEQPTDQSIVIRSLMRPTPCGDEKGKGKTRWPINEQRGAASTLAWAFILGVENGWFEFCGSHLNWSAAGRHRYEAGDATAVAPGAQVSFAF